MMRAFATVLGLTFVKRIPLSPYVVIQVAPVRPYVIAFSQFCIRWLVRHSPYGPWVHVLPHVWTGKSNAATIEDEGEDEVEMCALCCHKRSTVTVCGECKEHYCCECIDTHTCGNDIIC